MVEVIPFMLPPCYHSVPLSAFPLLLLAVALSVMLYIRFRLSKLEEYPLAERYALGQSNLSRSGFPCIKHPLPSFDVLLYISAAWTPKLVHLSTFKSAAGLPITHADPSSSIQVSVSLPE